MNNTVSINPDKLYTKSEYSKKVGITRVTIDKRIKEGSIKILKVNGTVLIRE